MNRLYRKEIKEFFSVLITNHVTKLEKPDDSEFGNVRHLGSFHARGDVLLCGECANMIIPWFFLLYFM